MPINHQRILIEVNTHTLSLLNHEFVYAKSDRVNKWIAS